MDNGQIVKTEQRKPWAAITLLSLPILPLVVFIVALIIWVGFPHLFSSSYAAMSNSQLAGWGTIAFFFERILSLIWLMLVLCVLLSACMPTSVIALVLSIRRGKRGGWTAGSTSLIVVSICEIAMLTLPTLISVMYLFSMLKSCLSRLICG